MLLSAVGKWVVGFVDELITKMTNDHENDKRKKEDRDIADGIIKIGTTGSRK
jgi:hypothetical protein